MKQYLILFQEEANMWTKLLVKLEGWWDAIILRLPNLAVAILVMVIF